jgi:hypothetical protein
MIGLVLGNFFAHPPVSTLDFGAQTGCVEKFYRESLRKIP